MPIPAPKEQGSAFVSVVAAYRLFYSIKGLIQNKNGGGEWESNPPRTGSPPNTGFEDQEQHQLPVTSTEKNPKF